VFGRYRTDNGRNRQLEWLCIHTSRSFVYFRLNISLACTPWQSTKIQVQCNEEDHTETHRGDRIDPYRVAVGSCQLIYLILDKRVRQVAFAEAGFYLPLPVGNWAVADAIPNAQYEPRCCREQHAIKMPAASGGPDPAQQVKPD